MAVLAGLVAGLCWAWTVSSMFNPQWLQRITATRLAEHNEPWRISFAADPKTSRRQLALLACDRSEAVRATLAQQPNLDPRLIEILGEDENERVLEALARQALPEHLQHRFAAHESHRVRHALLRCPNLPYYSRLVLAQEAATGGPSFVPPVTATWLLDAPERNDAALLAACASRPNLAQALLKNSSCTLELAVALVQTGVPYVAYHVLATFGDEPAVIDAVLENFDSLLFDDPLSTTWSAFRHMFLRAPAAPATALGRFPACMVADLIPDRLNEGADPELHDIVRVLANDNPRTLAEVQNSAALLTIP